MASVIDFAKFEAAVRDLIDKDIAEEVEMVIAKYRLSAADEIEQIVRQKVADVAMKLAQNYSLDRDRNEIVIRVRIDG